jgi:AcrR family transcriptional regulator
MIMQMENKKYHQILQSARNLFWKYGLKRVSVEEICREAGVSKMTFYRFFPNKIELAKAVFDIAVDEGKQKFLDILADSTDIQEKIASMIDLKLKSTNDISPEFLMDLYKNPETGLKEHVEKASAARWNELIRYFRLGQRKGIFRKEIKPEFLLYYSRKIGEMVTDENLIRLYGSPQHLIRELTTFFVYGVSSRNELK